MLKTRPFLVVPQLIEQPTWGGDYILKLKNWQDEPQFKNKKIGQSHELSGSSLLATNITDSRFLKSQGESSTPISQIESKEVLLIKLNQASGNSFQLHIKPEVKSSRWKPKPESWYFLEPGHITLGLKLGANLDKFKIVCQEIEKYMEELSKQILTHKLTLEQARADSKKFIIGLDPWQFVNMYDVEKYQVIDLSKGAIQHSWEEDLINHPNGNIVFEVQLDASDDDATIRAFDQGKIKEDGTVRKMNIQDFFQHIDSDPSHNKLENLQREIHGENILNSKFYSINLLEPKSEITINTNQTYHHLYVRDGQIAISANGVTVKVDRGFSCFVPSSVESYIITPESDNCAVLKTYIK